MIHFSYKLTERSTIPTIASQHVREQDGQPMYPDIMSRDPLRSQPPVVRLGRLRSKSRRLDLQAQRVPVRRERAVGDRRRGECRGIREPHWRGLLDRVRLSSTTATSLPASCMMAETDDAGGSTPHCTSRHRRTSRCCTSTTALRALATRMSEHRA